MIYWFYSALVHLNYLASTSQSPSEKPWRESCLSAMAAVGADANCQGGGDPTILPGNISS